PGVRGSPARAAPHRPYARPGHLCSDVWRLTTHLDVAVSRRLPAQRAALLQDGVDVAVEGGEGGVEVEVAADGELEVVRETRRDALPFRDLRRRDDGLELAEEGGRARIGGDAARGPRRAARREVTGERVEAARGRRLGEMAHERARELGLGRPARDDEAR